jgi:hypothetical protein
MLLDEEEVNSHLGNSTFVDTRAAFFIFWNEVSSKFDDKVGPANDTIALRGHCQLVVANNPARGKTESRPKAEKDKKRQERKKKYACRKIRWEVHGYLEAVRKLMSNKSIS